MFQESRFSSAALGLIFLAMSGCYVRPFPPPVAPAPSMPVLVAPLPEVSPGSARVVVATDVPARVIGRRRSGGGWGAFSGGQEAGTGQIVCARTPCVVITTYGELPFRFEGVDDGGRSSEAK